MDFPNPPPSGKEAPYRIMCYLPAADAIRIRAMAKAIHRTKTARGDRINGASAYLLDAARAMLKYDLRNPVLEELYEGELSKILEQFEMSGTIWKPRWRKKRKKIWGILRDE